MHSKVKGEESLKKGKKKRRRRKRRLLFFLKGKVSLYKGGKSEEEEETLICFRTAGREEECCAFFPPSLYAAKLCRGFLEGLLQLEGAKKSFLCMQMIPFHMYICKGGMTKRGFAN